MRSFLLYNFCMKNDIKIHYSLLPAFDCEEPIKEAFLSGVKVSGVTIYRDSDKKIIAQYPVLITNSMHYDDFEKEILKTGGILYNKVIESIEKDIVFDFDSLFSNKCNSCSNCGKCH